MTRFNIGFNVFDLLVITKLVVSRTQCNCLAFINKVFFHQKHLSIPRGVSLQHWFILPPANRVCGKVIFLHVCVILSTGGGSCLPQYMLGCHPPRGRHHPRCEQTPPGAEPPGADIPLEQTPPRADTPESRHPPKADTPPEQTPPRRQHPLPEQSIM